MGCRSTRYAIDVTGSLIASFESKDPTETRTWVLRAASGSHARILDIDQEGNSSQLVARDGKYAILMSVFSVK